MKQILPNIFAVEVPEEYNRFKISGTNYLCGCTIVESPHLQALPPRLEDEYSILGTVTKDTIEFDVEPYLNYDAETGAYPYYENREGKNAICFSSNQSFRSALSAAGIYFENPYGDYPNEITSNSNVFDVAEWKDAQSKIVSKIVILKKL